MGDLEKLAARVEAAEGADERHAFRMAVEALAEHGMSYDQQCEALKFIEVGAYLNAAASLMPDDSDLTWQLETACGGDDRGSLIKVWSEADSDYVPLIRTASTPGLATLAAALRARAAEGAHDA